MTLEQIEDVAKEAVRELYRATEKFGAFHNSHEGFAVLKEEVDELWDEIKGGQDKQRMKEEAIQIAAMAIRFVVDICEDQI